MEVGDEIREEIFNNEIQFIAEDDEDYDELVQMLHEDIEDIDIYDPLTIVYLYCIRKGDGIVLEDCDYGSDFYTYGDIIKIGNEEYVVVPYDDMEALFHDYMEEYIDECILYEIPEQYRAYFDYEKFIDYVECNDGFDIMSSYDGCIDDIDILGESYYIFRIN